MDIEIKKEDENKSENEKKFKKILIIPLILFIIVLLIVYSRYKATTGLKINEHIIKSETIPESFKGTKIIHLSDIHYKNTVDKKYLEKIIEEINKTKPDILILTGDLLDKEITEEEKEELINTLKQLNIKISAYAIMGDTDYNKELWNEIITKSGFIDLNNKEAYVYNKSTKPIIITNTDNTYENIYSIYIVHKPDTVDKLKNKFNLILAGHSLNGQINIPLIKKLFLQQGAKKYYKNHYKIKGTDMFISSGIGTTKFKFRLFNTPSIELYRLTNK